MNKRVLLALVASTAMMSLAPGARAASKTLAVPTHFQEQSQWCWNACSQMVMRYYGKHFADQCEFADVARTLNPANFGAVHCCLEANENLGNTGVVGCNQPLWPQDTMAIFNLPTTTNWSTTITYAAGKAEIDANRPFITNWNWNGGGAHVLVVKGYSDASGGNPDRFNIVNPGFNVGAQLMDYTAVVGCNGTPGCTSDHVWSTTILTQTPSTTNDSATLYSSASYAGTATAVTASVANLGANSNTASSAKVRGVPYIFFDATNYGTPAWSVTPRDFASYTAWGETTDNQVSSVLKMPSNTERIAVVLYDGQNFTGSSVTLTANSTTLPAGWDNKVSSLIVVGKIWQLYSSTNYGGNPYAVTSYGGPNRDGFYPTPSSWGGVDNDASSARYVDATEIPLLNPVMLYQNTDLGGRAVVLWDGAPGINDLASIGFNDTISSIRTYGDVWTVFANTNQAGASQVLVPNRWYRSAAEWGGTDNTITSLDYNPTGEWTGE